MAATLRRPLSLSTTYHHHNHHHNHRHKPSTITFLPYLPNNTHNLTITLSKPSRPPLAAVTPSCSGGAPNFGSSQAVTLEKPKPELDHKSDSRIPEPLLADFDNSGSGGNNGRFTGGGDNGGSGFGDDDDYFDDFDDDGDEGDDNGLFRIRMRLQELFDRRFIDAVLREWQKTMMDLPAGMHQAYELGIVSSAEVMKFLVNGAAPTLTRAISRALPQGMSRAFIGRMIADPAFLHKLLFEQFVTVAYSVHSELKNRGNRIRHEWDLALINVITAAACNLVVVWSLAPCRSFGNTFRFNLQNRLQKLPNNVFEANYCFKEFDLQKRIQSFVYKAVELSLVGFTAGAVQSGLSNLCARKKEGRLSVQIPPANTNALGYGAFLGLYTNWRYQMMCGIDQVLINRFDVIGVALFFTTAFRLLNVQLGEISRAAWLEAEHSPSVSQRSLDNKNLPKRRRRITRRVPSYELA